MKKILVFLCAMLLVFAITGMAKAEVILSEDFEDSSGFTLAGCVPLGYWGIALLSGTASIPSQFQQGSSSQDGNIFYGSFAKENQSSPAATMTIALPDLSGYTNLELTVALATSENEVLQRGNFEPSHRDSLRIIGNTTISPPIVDCSMSSGCESETEEIDIFLPITYPDYLRSKVYPPIGLGHAFQDFTYLIDNDLKSLTFAFASTDYPEKVGIDSVRITGDLLFVPIALDIKPGSCPNPLNVKSKGVLPVAIAGTSSFDVTQVDPASVLLEGAAPLRWAYVDTTTPFEPFLGKQDCNEDCDELFPDGILDLAFNFDRQEIIAELGGVEDGECLVLILTGNLKEEFGGTAISGEDVMIILEKGKK